MYSLDNGLTVYRSQFSPANPDEIGCIGGPIDVLESIVYGIGPKSAVRYIGHLIRNISELLGRSDNFRNEQKHVAY